MPMFDASEWLRSVTDAVTWERNDRAYMDALRESSLSLGCHWRDVVVASSGSGDRMAAVVARIFTIEVFDLVTAVQI